MERSKPLRHGIEVPPLCAMSNRTVIYDRGGRYPEFVEHFHKLLAREPERAAGSVGQPLVIGAGLRG